MSLYGFAGLIRQPEFLTLTIIIIMIIIFWLGLHDYYSRLFVWFVFKSICRPITPTFVDRRAAAVENLPARRRCHCCCVLILLQFSMTEKGHQKILRLERNLFGILCRQFLGPAARPAADQNWPARRGRHSYVGARLYTSTLVRPNWSVCIWNSVQ